MSKIAVVKRSDFVRHLHEQAGLPYLKAEQVYTVWMRALENALAAKSTINLGRVGVLRPVELAPRRVVMGCKRAGGAGGGKMEKVRREYFLGVRSRFVFRLNKAFGRHHELVP